MKWKIWLDDIRESPQDYVWCRSVNECKKQIELCEALEGVGVARYRPRPRRIFLGRW